MSLVIRPAAPTDISEILRLEEASFPAPWRREFFENEIHASGRFNLVACTGESLVGYLFAMWLFDEMHINKIAVAEEERRRGIAARLMDECVLFARRSGITTISLEVRQSNDGAQEFYRHIGFKPIYLRPRYYPDGEGAVVMAREIGRIAE